MTDTPQYFVYDAERSVMVPRRKALADKQYVDGQEYRLGVIEERSANSHSHFFAALTKAWKNLPDDLAERFPTPDALRKYALIKAGFYDSSEFACASQAEALRLASFLRPIDEYALIVVKGNAVRRLVAKSQSTKAMGKDDFQQSKTAVLEIVSAMIGVAPKAVAENAA